MDPITQGLSISLVGLALTFAALALFILCMVVLQRLFRPKPPASAGLAPDKTPPATRQRRNLEEQEIAAAIAIALSQLRSLEICRSGLGDALESGRGRWWARGQAAALDLRPGRTDPRRCTARAGGKARS